MTTFLPLKTRFWKYLATAGLIGCVPYPHPKPAVYPPPKQPPTLSSQTPKQANRPTFGTHARSGPWAFSYAPRTETYIATTTAHVSSPSDTNITKTLPVTAKQITVVIGGDGIVQNISTTLITDGPTATDQPTLCDTIATLRLKAKEIIPKLPRKLHADSSWGDSSTVNACLGTAPAQINIQRIYTVLGDTLDNDSVLIHVRRLETIKAIGEETVGQHRVQLAVAGNDTTDFYLNQNAGRLQYAKQNQRLNLDITGSGETTHFIQSLTRNIVLQPKPK